MSIRTPLCDLLGIEHPVLLAPMAGVSGGALDAAVSKAGGLGLIGGGYGDADWLKREFDAAGASQIGVGFVTWSLALQPHLLDLALDRPIADLHRHVIDRRLLGQRKHIHCLDRFGECVFELMHHGYPAEETADLGIHIRVPQRATRPGPPLFVEAKKSALRDAARILGNCLRGMCHSGWVV